MSRIKRDIRERGRTVDSVLHQYHEFVKPGFIQYIQPSKGFADIIVPRARDNVVAIGMITRDLQTRIRLEAEACAAAAKTST